MERSNRSLVIGLGVLALVLLVAVPALSGGMMMSGGMAGYGPFGMRPIFGFGAPWLWGFWGAGLLVRLLFFGLIVFLLMRLFRGRRYGAYRNEPDSMALSAEEILRRRYAVGEISREQYEEMHRTLEPSTT
jgi:putative membrane protein